MSSMDLRLTGVVDVNELMSVVDEALVFANFWKPISDFLLVSQFFLKQAKLDDGVYRDVRLNIGLK